MTVLTTSPAPVAGLAAMTEDEMCAAVGAMERAYGVPVAWLAPDRLAIVAFTADPTLALLAADQFCRTEIGDGYPELAGGVVVDGPVEAVLVTSQRPNRVLWRPARTEDEAAVCLCVVRPSHAARDWQRSGGDDTEAGPRDLPVEAVRP